MILFLGGLCVGAALGIIIAALLGANDDIDQGHP